MSSMNIDIIKDKKRCEMLLDFNDYRIDGWRTKKILNDHYKPEEFLFFCDGVGMIPLVRKGDLITYYGGLHYNEKITITGSSTLLNFAIDYIKNNNLRLRLLSIVNDPLELLSEENKKYDVPFNQYWVFKNIINYSLESLNKNWNSNFRRKVSIMMDKLPEYQIRTLNYNEFKVMRSKIIEGHIAFFNKRNHKSAWEDNTELFESLTDQFMEDGILIPTVFEKRDGLIGCNILLKDDSIISHWFTTRLDDDKDWLPILLYLDALETAQKMANKESYSELDATRGAFTYKPKMGFSPLPSYAIVLDKEWEVKYSDDLSKEDTIKLYGRDFGALQP